jgi:predicted RNA-binding Zn-ribbon protein involved in translation (DUF1610 family)
MNTQFNNMNNNLNNANMMNFNPNNQIYNNNNYNNFQLNNNFNKFSNFQNNVNYNNNMNNFKNNNINNISNFQNNNFNNQVLQSPTIALYHCPKCNNLIDKKLKEDHLLSHQIDEAEKNVNHRRPLNQENRYNRLIRNNMNQFPRFRMNIDNNTMNTNTSIPNMNRNIINNNAMNRHNNNHNNLNNHLPLFIIIRSKSNINHEHLNFPEIVIQDINKLEEANRKCMICLEDFKVKEKVTALPCIHFFHPNCIKEWIERKNECPVCKFELTTQNINKKMSDL